jgi:prephenate dehydrogenase
MPFTQITIIGTGLIGGSFGLAARAAGFKGKIIGCDRKEVLNRALARRAIDAGSEDPMEAIQGSDLILLATPVGAIIDMLERIGPTLIPGTLLTDVGSTKKEILERARSVFGVRAPQRFLGGHPLAGKEHGGIDHAEAALLNGAVWFLVPQQGQDMNFGRTRDYWELLEKMGLRVVLTEAVRHDQLCAWTSHLPQLISTALAASLVDEFGSDPALSAFAGRALREMTRVAASPYPVWRDIVHTNAANIEQALSKLEQRLAHIRENLRSSQLRAEFDRANSFEIGSQEVAATVLVLPGWQNSGPQHWQTLWEQQDPIFLRVQQKEWNRPAAEAWIRKIGEEVVHAPAPIVFAAHSLGCIALAHWCQTHPAEITKIKGALLVAPSDVERKDTPPQITGFTPIPRDPFPFPTIVVASRNDPYLTLTRARELARLWGSKFIDIGPAGHINGDSGLGDWPEGKRLLRHLAEGV